MERLTTRHNGVAVIKDKSKHKEAMEKLARYEELEELQEGILVVLNKDGVAELYDSEWDITIHCTSEEEHKKTVGFIQDAVKKRWCPVDERFPKNNKYILLSFENSSIPAVGRYDQDENGNGNFYLGDCDGADTCLAEDLYVNAWMPLPEPYRKDVE